MQLYDIPGTAAAVKLFIPSLVNPEQEAVGITSMQSEDNPLYAIPGMLEKITADKPEHPPEESVDNELMKLEVIDLAAEAGILTTQ